MAVGVSIKPAVPHEGKMYVKMNAATCLAEEAARYVLEQMDFDSWHDYSLTSKPVRRLVDRDACDVRLQVRVPFMSRARFLKFNISCEIVRPTWSDSWLISKIVITVNDQRIEVDFEVAELSMANIGSIFFNAKVMASRESYHEKGQPKHYEELESAFIGIRRELCNLVRG